MNKDLEIIKENLTMLKGYTSEEADEILDMSINAAEHMAAEIDANKKKINDLETFIITLSDEKNNEIASLKANLEKKSLTILTREETIKNYFTKIILLEAELEKRPEIVRCEECKFRGTDNCWLAEIDDTDDEYETFWDPQTDDNDFCSHGQRRESEGK